jgi:hypothetical protein
MAEVYVTKQEKKPLGTGYNEYRYIDNRIDWVPALDADGYPMKDPNGENLIKPDKVPGTIFCMYLVRMVYQRLKKAYYDGHLYRR